MLVFFCSFVPADRFCVIFLFCLNNTKYSFIKIYIRPFILKINFGGRSKNINTVSNMRKDELYGRNFSNAAKHGAKSVWQRNQYHLAAGGNVDNRRSAYFFSH